MKPLLLISLLPFSIGVCSAQKIGMFPNPPLDTEKDTVKNHHILGTVYYIFPAIYQCACCGKEFNLHDLRHTPCDKKCSPFSLISQDTLTAQRFIQDSLGNNYMVEYTYKPIAFYRDKEDSLHTLSQNHTHYIAICHITKFKGNKTTTIANGIKAIYSPTECSSDNPKLWLKRTYEYLKHKP